MSESANTVLVVDDSILARKQAVYLLHQVGVPTLEANNGDEAISILRERQAEIAMVLLDLEMPVMDGPATVTFMRSLGIELPVVLATSSTDVKKVGECLRAGVSDYLIKPVDFDALVQRITPFVQMGDAPIDENESDAIFRIMLFESSEKAADRFKALLPPGVGCEVANNIYWAQSLLEEHTFDRIVITAKPNGNEHVQHLKELKEVASGMPIFAAYLRIVKEPTERAFNEGFDGCLLKPFSKEQIKEFVGNAATVGKILEVRSEVVTMLPKNAGIDSNDYYSQMGLELGTVLEGLAEDAAWKVVVDCRSAPAFEYFGPFLQTCQESGISIGLEVAFWLRSGHLTDLELQGLGLVTFDTQSDVEAFMNDTY